MSQNSKIEWTETTWNPVLGCSKISEGCRHCYAIRSVHRMAGNPNAKIRAANEGLTVIQNGAPNWTGRVRLIEDRLMQPLRWRTPRRIFVNSLSDLFHDGLTDEDIDRVFAVMALCPQHTFQVLTKRPRRMQDYFASKRGHFVCEYQAIPAKSVSQLLPFDNIWLGVSCEDQKTADERIPLLLQTPAAVRWISAEPLLGPLDLKGFPPFSWTPIPHSVQRELRRQHPRGLPANSLNAEFSRMKLDQIIVGGESGPGARPMNPEWVRSIRDQCSAAGVAFFCKQITERGRKISFDQWPDDLKIREFPLERKP